MNPYFKFFCSPMSAAALASLFIQIQTWLTLNKWIVSSMRISGEVENNIIRITIYGIPDNELGEEIFASGLFADEGEIPMPENISLRLQNRLGGNTLIDMDTAADENSQLFIWLQYRPR